MQPLFYYTEKMHREEIAITLVVPIRTMLEDLFDAGYETVWIGPCKYWKGAPSTSIIGTPECDDHTGWPALWGIVRNGIGMSCGNGLGGQADQAQADQMAVSNFGGEYTKSNYIEILEELEEKFLIKNFEDSL